MPLVLTAYPSMLTLFPYHSTAGLSLYAYGTFHSKLVQYLMSIGKKWSWMYPCSLCCVLVCSYHEAWFLKWPGWILGIWGVSAATSCLILQNYLHMPWSPATWITAIHFYLVLLTRRLFSFNVSRTPWPMLLLRNLLWPAVFHFYAPFAGCQ